MKHSSLSSVEHRPWPLPNHEWKWRQSWLDLAFIHYRVEATQIQELLPPGLQLQEFDGSAWVGVVPFRMAGVMRCPFPDVPFFSSFPELNLRTYVECDGKPGVWFFSLDAASWPVVFGGKIFYHLPYHSAKMWQVWKDGWCHFSSRRRSSSAGFEARYRPVGEVFTAVPGTFEHWATERYCLYSHSRCGGVTRVEVHHVPWPIQHAEGDIKKCGLLQAAGLTPLSDEAVIHFSTGVNTVSFGCENVILE